MKHWNYENFKKGPLTSLVGLALIAASVFVFIEVPNSEVYSLALLGAGAVAFGLKDPRIPPAGGLIPLVVITLLTVGCTSFNRCAKKFGTGATHSIIIRDTVKVEVPVTIPADSAGGTVPCDELNPGDTITEVSESGKLEVQFWRDASTGSALHYKAKIKRDTIYVTKEIPVEVRGDCPDTVILDPEKGAPAWHRWLNGYKNFSAWAFLLMIVLLIIMSKFK